MKISQVLASFPLSILLAVTVMPGHCALPMEIASDPNMQEIVALNYLSSTIFRVQNNTDRLTLQRAYDEVFSNINLKKLPKKDLINKIQTVMDQLTVMQINAITKNELEEQRENIFQELLLKEIDAKGANYVTDWMKHEPSSTDFVSASVQSLGPKFLTKYVPSSMVSATGAALTPFGVVVAGTTALFVGMRLYDDYRLYSDRVEELELKLKEDELSSYNESCKGFLEEYWEVINTTSIPDSARLTKLDFDLYSEAINEQNDISRYRKLTLNEKRLQFIPEYWVRRAQTALKLWVQNQNEIYTKDVAYCYEQYRFFEGFLRVDMYKAELERIYIQSQDLSREEAQNHIHNLLSIAPHNSENILFAALTALRYSDIPSAITHLRLNLEMQQMQSASRALLSKIMLVDDRQDPVISKSIETLISSQSSTYQELLYFYNNYKPKTDTFKSFLPNFSEINLKISKSLFSDEQNLTLTLPEKWKIDNNVTLKASIYIKNKLREVDKVSYDEEKHVYTLKFRKLGTLNEFIGEPGSLEIRIAAQYFPIRIRATLETIMTEKGKLSILVDKISDKIPFTGEDKSSTRENVKFGLGCRIQEICSADVCYSPNAKNQFVIHRKPLETQI